MSFNHLFRPASCGRRLAPLAAVFCLAGLVAACGSSATFPLEKPAYFSGRVDKRSGVMAGRYNPAGYSQAQVRELVANVCEGGRLATYSEAPEAGLMSYSTTCRGEVSPRYSFVSFERLAAGRVLLEATGSDGMGNLIFTKRQLPLGARRGGSAAPVQATAAATSPAEPVQTEAAVTAPSAGPRCRNSVTVYCKDPASGRILPQVSPEDS